jgi:small conductance mechanosensitive channel
MSLGTFGVKTTSFAAVLGAAGLAVGLALQGTLSNFAAGVMLLIFRPFKVGDTVDIGGKRGKVDEIDIFFTILDTPDNRRFILPNGQVFGAAIENVTFHAIRRADVLVGTDYAADLDETRAVLEAAAALVPGQSPDKPSQVVLVGMGASSIDWEVRVWAPKDTFLDVLQASRRAVKQALDSAGIGIPFPQVDVNFSTPLPRS